VHLNEDAMLPLGRLKTCIYYLSCICIKKGVGKNGTLPLRRSKTYIKSIGVTMQRYHWYVVEDAHCIDGWSAILRMIKDAHPRVMFS
jgi:hypothetical protein